jgi:hypothetical protein
MWRTSSLLLSFSLMRALLSCLTMALLEVGCGAAPHPQLAPPSQAILAPVSTEINNKLDSMTLQSSTSLQS